ncbi:MAG TPA: PH domain-containing protein [Pseudonocardia sp.]
MSDPETRSEEQPAERPAADGAGARAPGVPSPAEPAADEPAADEPGAGAGAADEDATGGAADEGPDEGPDEGAADVPGHADGTISGPIVFRISPLAVLAVVAFTVCLSPVALTAPYGGLLFLIPLGLVGWVLWVRTTVDTESLAVRGAGRPTRVAWSEVTALRLRTRSRVSAVLTSGAELPLPAVHVRDLPLLAMASGGRLPDPGRAPTTGRPAQPAPRKE